MLLKCHLCNFEKETNKNGLLSHYKFKHKKELKENKNEIILHCIKEADNLNDADITNIIEMYNNKHSINDIKLYYNIVPNVVLNILKIFEINIRGPKEAGIISSIKSKKTCQTKYGVDNVSQIELIKEKKKNTFLENYGVDNIWKSKEYYVWLNEHCLSKFGKKRVTNSETVSKGNIDFWKKLNTEERKIKCNKISIGLKNWWKNASDEERNKRIKPWLKGKEKYLVKLENGEIERKNITFNSNLEKRIYNIATKFNIEITTQKFINKRPYDFCFMKNILLEVQGDFWHANPEIYDKDDILNFPNSNGVYAKDIWKNDYIKKQNAEKYNYKIFYIWESEMKNVNDETLEKLLIRRIKECLT